MAYSAALAVEGYARDKDEVELGGDGGCADGWVWFADVPDASLEVGLEVGDLVEVEDAGGAVDLG